MRLHKRLGRFISFGVGKTCSRDCDIAWRSKNEVAKAKISAAMSGGKHPLWQGGKSQLANYGKRGLGWEAIRLRVLKRDGGRCVDCGMTRDQCRQAYGRDLDVDHIEPFHNFALHREANRLKNLASRCASCHKIAETKRTNVQMALPFGKPSRTHRGVARGERSPKTSLTAIDVLAIRRRAAAGETGAALAREFGMAKGSISRILRRKTWAHI